MASPVYQVQHVGLAGFTVGVSDRSSEVASVPAAGAVGVSETAERADMLARREAAVVSAVSGRGAVVHATSSSPSEESTANIFPPFVLLLTAAAAAAWGLVAIEGVLRSNVKPRSSDVHGGEAEES